MFQRREYEQLVVQHQQLFHSVCPPQFQVEWDLDDELRTDTYFALNLNGAAVIAHDSVRDRQPQAGALTNRFSGEERVEDLATNCFRNTTSRVSNRDQEKVGSLAGCDRNRALTGNGVHRVCNQVHQYLLE